MSLDAGGLAHRKEEQRGKIFIVSTRRENEAVIGTEFEMIYDGSKRDQKSEEANGKTTITTSSTATAITTTTTTTANRATAITTARQHHH